MIEHDDSRVIYDDTRYFSRGRSGYRPDPATRERADAVWAIVAVAVIVAVFIIVRIMMPAVK